MNKYKKNQLKYKDQTLNEHLFYVIEVVPIGCLWLGSRERYKNKKHFIKVLFILSYIT